MRTPLLEIRHLRAGYGEAVVLDDVSLALAAGQTLALLGRNGVGKTTLLAAIMGHARRFGGEMRMNGRPLDGATLHARAQAGIGWVPQQRAVFPSLTVIENLTVAARPGAWTLDRVCALFPRLAERARNLGNQLSGGEQQMLAIGRALLLNPTLVLLDEPFEGLAPVIVDELAAAIRCMRDEEQMTLILVEQHAVQALELSDLALVLDRGRAVYAGTAAQLLSNRMRLETLVSIREAAACATRGTLREPIAA